MTRPADNFGWRAGFGAGVFYHCRRCRAAFELSITADSDFPNCKEFSFCVCLFFENQQTANLSFVFVFFFSTCYVRYLTGTTERVNIRRTLNCRNRDNEGASTVDNPPDELNTASESVRFHSSTLNIVGGLCEQHVDSINGVSCCKYNVVWNLRFRSGPKKSLICRRLACGTIYTVALSFSSSRLAS